MATRMIAHAIKMSGEPRVVVAGDPDYAAALAAAAVSPDMAQALEDNRLLREQLSDLERKYNKLRHLYYGNKITRLQESNIHREKSWWYTPIAFVWAAIYLGVTGFVRLLVVKED